MTDTFVFPVNCLSVSLGSLQVYTTKLDTGHIFIHGMSYSHPGLDTSYPVSVLIETYAPELNEQILAAATLRFEDMEREKYEALKDDGCTLIADEEEDESDFDYDIEDYEAAYDMHRHSNPSAEQRQEWLKLK